MPQFIEFPALPSGEYRAAVDTLIRFCQRVPERGEALKDVRARLKQMELYNRERLPALWRFLRVAADDPFRPSLLMREIATAKGDLEARRVLAERLWHINPVLMKCVLDRMAERVHSPNELLKYLDSFAYPGARLTGPQVRSWLALSQGIGFFKTVGIRLGVDELAAPYVERAALLDFDEFFDEDLDEPLPESESLASEAGVQQTATPTVEEQDRSPVVRATSPPTSAAVSLTSTAPPPVRVAVRSLTDNEAPVSPRNFSTTAILSDDVLVETARRISSVVGPLPSSDPPIDAVSLGFDAEVYASDPERGLFKLAVASTLVCRLPPAVAREAWLALSSGDVLDALFDGSMPTSNPGRVDPHALMWASLLSRRFTEHPDLATNLERVRTADLILTTLESALGRGLLTLELFWILRSLQELGLFERGLLSDVAALADRPVRDILFRLGFISTPYAPDLQALSVASAAVRKAVGDTAAPENRLRAFALAAGCAYGCLQVRTCGFACRERAEVS